MKPITCANRYLGTGKEYTAASIEADNATEAVDTGNETEESAYTQE